jgi:hypothetical protein
MKKKTPSRRQVAAALSQEIRMYRVSYEEADGVVRDEGALSTIACLLEPRLMVRNAPAALFAPPLSKP